MKLKKSKYQPYDNQTLWEVPGYSFYLLKISEFYGGGDNLKAEIVRKNNPNNEFHPTETIASDWHLRLKDIRAETPEAMKFLNDCEQLTKEREKTAVLFLS